ncbi:hypothetical protein [Halobacterium sp. R2-5]|uniref:hypothetical protein n=1 Tax=Halobacterium sp. R2-5 TaxID=2715751 RepID=UPI0014247FAB|nr:hypothetical protein [Halobacterium sp. R2-5]NIC00901.1 hypothetical protein [Halobacterium sp. R2-5]
MSFENLNTERLVESTVAPRDVVIAGDHSTEPDREARCAICGTPQSDAIGLPVRYANPVCKECDALAVNEEGSEPWEGYPPSERPETDDSVIHLEPDHGENPVYIAGVKCWRRYRFGGWITRRDAYDCSSLEEFREYHRLDGHPIHAFNVAQPGGVELTRESCGSLQDRYQCLQSIYEDAQSVADNSPSESAVMDLWDQLERLDSSITADLLDPDQFTPREVAVMLADELQSLLQTRLTASDSGAWITRAKLCNRYFAE